MLERVAQANSVRVNAAFRLLIKTVGDINILPPMLEFGDIQLAVPDNNIETSRRFPPSGMGG